MTATDEKSFLSRLVDEEYDHIFKYALALTHREDDAEDLTQETFLIAARNAGELEKMDNPSGWLRATLYHRWQHYVERDRRERDRRRGDPGSGLALPDRTPNPEDAVLTDMALSSALTEREYALARLVFLEELSLTQAARALKISPAACRKRIERLRLKLRERYPLD